MAKDYACVLQHDQADCGPAALATVAKHFRLTIGIASIRNKVGTDRVGTNLLGLLKGAEAIGFTAKGVKGDWDGLRKVPLPAICHTLTEQKFGHFVVVHRLTDERAVIADPGQGVIELDRAAFCERWTGYALLLTPGVLTADAPAISKSAFIRELLAPHHGILAGALICSLIITVLGFATSLFVKHLVDHILVHQQTKVLTFAIVGMAILLVFKAVFEFTRGWFLIDAGRKVDLVLISCYLRHVMHQPMRFFETRQVGEILSRVGDAAKIRQLISSTALTTLVDGGTIVIAAAVMLLTDWRLALACLLFLPLAILVAAVLRRPLGRGQRELMVKTAGLEAQLVEDVSGVETIKAYGHERTRLQKSENRLVGISRTLLSTSLIATRLHIATTFMTGAATLTLLGYGAHRVLDGDMTIGTLMFFFSLSAYLYGPLERLVDVMVTVQDAGIALNRLWEILTLELEGKEMAGRHAPSSADLARMAMSIRFEQVVFGYGYRGTVLNGIDLEIPASRVAALVGVSGGGKSTICKLLTRYYDPTGGRILVDGVDLRDLPHDLWRQQIGYVSQEAHIFNGTVAENIALGRPDAGLPAIMDAAEMAGIGSFIDTLPERYQTIIGERGANLSGGQRQRLAIARAFLADPRLFIFDESTSQLDTRTERTLQQHLRRIMHGRTALIIAHRLSTIRHADIIHVMDGGVIVERGNHDELIAKGGEYARLWSAQTGGDEPVGTDRIQENGVADLVAPRIVP